MSAVWRASRAAVRRRRLQTFVIGLVVLCSTTTVLLALGLLDAASSPFDRAYAAQRGAHTVATFDTAKVSPGQLERTARQPGVEAAAGPFGQGVVDVPEGWLWMSGGSLTVVGRADPGARWTGSSCWRATGRRRPARSSSAGPQTARPDHACWEPGSRCRVARR